MESEEGRIEGRVACRQENVVSNKSRSLVGVGDPWLGTMDSNVNLFYKKCVKL